MLCHVHITGNGMQFCDLAEDVVIDLNNVNIIVYLIMITSKILRVHTIENVSVWRPSFMSQFNGTSFLLYYAYQPEPSCSTDKSLSKFTTCVLNLVILKLAMRCWSALYDIFVPFVSFDMNASVQAKRWFTILLAPISFLASLFLSKVKSRGTFVVILERSHAND